MEEAAQEIPEFLEQYKDGATTQTEKRFDALDHHEELAKHGTEIFNMQARVDSWNSTANPPSDSVAPVDDGWGMGTAVVDDGWGEGTAVVGDGWGAGTANTGSSW